MLWRLRHKLFGTDFVLYGFIHGWAGKQGQILPIISTPNGKDLIKTSNHGIIFLDGFKPTDHFTITHLTRQEPCAPTTSPLLELCPPRSSCLR